MVIEYLWQTIDRRQSNARLHKDLIDGYSKQCNGRWSSHPHDDYYYQYLMHHAVQAEDDKIIQEIMRDFKWMNFKLQSDETIYNICTDLEEAMDYLRSKEIEVYRIN